MLTLAILALNVMNFFPHFVSVVIVFLGPKCKDAPRWTAVGVDIFLHVTLHLLMLPFGNLARNIPINSGQHTSDWMKTNVAKSYHAPREAQKHGIEKRESSTIIFTISKRCAAFRANLSDGAGRSTSTAQNMSQKVVMLTQSFSMKRCTDVWRVWMRRWRKNSQFVKKNLAAQ